jgi:hypothetical protein
MGISKRFRFLKRPKFIIPLVMAILIVAALVSTIRNLNAPAVGSFNQTPPSEGEIIDPYGQTGIYTGEHISFKYPAHYKSVPAKLSGDYGTEDTFYIGHNGLLATVSATAPYNNQAGDAVFVASSLKWL